MSLENSQAQQGQTFRRSQRILPGDGLPSSAGDALGQDGKRAEEALRETEERFRTLCEASFEGIAIHDKGTILDANQTLAMMFGYEVAEVIGMHVLDFAAPESRGLILQSILAKREEPFEAVGLRKDGSTFLTELRGKAIPCGGRMVTVAALRDITERKRAQEALRESERCYRLLAENAADMIWTMDMDIRAIYVNPAAPRIRGYSVEEVMAQTVEEMLTPASLEVVRKALAEELPIEKMEQKDLFRSRTLELEHICKDGSTGWAEVRMTALRDEHGRIVEILGVWRDISERKRAVEALRESERRYRLLAENATDIIWTRDMNLRPTYVSPSVTSILGYSVEEAMAQTIEEVLTPASLAEVMKTVAEELAIEKMEQKDLFRSRILVLERYCRDGSIVWLEARMTFLRDEDGQAVGILGVSRDITERKRAEEALRESERRHRLLAENATDIIWIRDMDIRAIYVNPAVTRIRGYSVEEVMAQPLEEVLTPASLELARQVVAEELAKEQVEKRDLFWWRTLELENTCKDGSTVWLEVRVTALRDEDKRIVGILGISRDISERKRAEEALQKAREELESRVERQVQRGNAYGLTFRELTVLHLVAAGESDKEIATVLGISPLTAHKHLANILKKMGAACRTEAGVRAVREELLD